MESSKTASVELYRTWPETPNVGWPCAKWRAQAASSEWSAKQKVVPGKRRRISTDQVGLSEGAGATRGVALQTESEGSVAGAATARGVNWSGGRVAGLLKQHTGRMRR